MSRKRKEAQGAAEEAAVQAIIEEAADKLVDKLFPTLRPLSALLDHPDEWVQLGAATAILDLLLPPPRKRDFGPDETSLDSGEEL